MPRNYKREAIEEKIEKDYEKIRLELQELGMITLYRKNLINKKKKTILRRRKKWKKKQSKK